jgi:ATP dependent DNA ligase domain
MNKQSKFDLPILYQRGKKGEVRVWRTWAVGDTVYAESGVRGGKLTQSSYRCEPKNVGRANATTAEEQAKLEAQADWTKKRDRKYSETVPPEDVTHENMPMLAHSFFVKGEPGVLTTHAKKVQWPVDVQVKFDGLRAKARRVDGKVVLLPRSGQLDEVYDAKHVIQQLDRWLPNGIELDGELYVHGKKLQEIASLAKRFRAPDSTILIYHVYDVPMLDGNRDAPWRDRRDHLAQITESPSVQRAKTVSASSVEDVVGFFRRFRERGFEGAMVRLLDGVYECGHRSASLLKVKEHMDAEFEVIGCEEGVGKDVGTATFVCVTEDGKEFRARMRGPIDDRRRFWAERARYIGRKLTVSFMRWTEEGKPQEPVGEVFREARDLG